MDLNIPIQRQKRIAMGYFMMLFFAMAVGLSANMVGTAILPTNPPSPAMRSVNGSRIPEWVHCTLTTPWEGNPPITVDQLNNDCQQAFEWMKLVDIDPNWGVGNIFEFAPVGVQPSMGLPVMRTPRRYTYGK